MDDSDYTEGSETIVVTYESDRGRKIRIWAIVLGGIAAILGIAMFFTQIVDNEGQLIEQDGFKVITLYVAILFTYLSGVVAVIGYFISWWHKLPAAILLVLAWVFLLVIDLLPDALKTPEFVEASQLGPEASGGPAFVFGIPALIAGLLFFWYLWLTRKSGKNTANT